MNSIPQNELDKLFRECVVKGLDYAEFLHKSEELKNKWRASDGKNKDDIRL